MPLTPDDLPRFHTKHLLSALRKSCATDDQVCQVNIDRAKHSLPPLSHFASKEAYYEQAQVYSRAFGYDDNVGCTITIKQLKDELAKRPHVPNKHESREKRRARTKTGKPRGRRDR